MAGGAMIGQGGAGEGPGRQPVEEGGGGLGILGAALVVSVVVAPYCKTLALVSTRSRPVWEDAGCVCVRWLPFPPLHV